MTFTGKVYFDHMVQKDIDIDAIHQCYSRLFSFTCVFAHVCLLSSVTVQILCLPQQSRHCTVPRPKRFLLICRTTPESLPPRHHPITCTSFLKCYLAGLKYKLKMMFNNETYSKSINLIYKYFLQESCSILLQMSTHICCCQVYMGIHMPYVHVSM